MPQLTLPPKTTEVLGEEAAAEFARWAAETFTVRDEVVHRDEFREVLSCLDIIEHDLAGVKERLDAVDARFDRLQSGMNDRFDRLQSGMNDRFDRMNSEMNDRFDRMNSGMNARFDAVNARIDTIHDVVRSQTRWLVGTLIAIGGLISVLITVFEFIK